MTLKPGEPIADFELEMIPRAAILGRVLDENGDPVPNVMVEAEAASSDNIRSFLGRAPNITNDRGEFRISRPPGKYYIQAIPNFQRSGSLPEIRLDGSTEVVYGPTYYPNGASTAQATVVEAAAGADVTGIEIRLIGQRGLMTISGAVSGIPDDPAPLRVSLIWSDSSAPNLFVGSRSTSVGPGGKFSFPRLQPGLYRLSATYSSGKTQLQSQVVDVRLDAADVANVGLTLSPGAELTGTVELAGELPGSKLPERPTVQIVQDTGSSSGAVDADGAFHITGVTPGRYRVRLASLPENAYIQSVKLDGAVAPDGELDLSHGVRGSHVKIAVNRKGAQVSGVLLDKDGQPAPNPLAVVLLVESGKETSFDGEPERMMRVEKDGKYVLHGIAPGKYRLLAVDVFRIADEHADEIVKKLLPKAEEIEFKEGDRITRDLKMLGKEDLDAKQ